MPSPVAHRGLWLRLRAIQVVARLRRLLDLGDPRIRFLTVTTCPDLGRPNLSACTCRGPARILSLTDIHYASATTNGLAIARERCERVRRATFRSYVDVQATTNSGSCIPGTTIIIAKATDSGCVPSTNDEVADDAEESHLPAAARAVGPSVMLPVDTVRTDRYRLRLQACWSSLLNTRQDSVGRDTARSVTDTPARLLALLVRGR